MAYITVENFKFGLDARRSELTSLPGTLLVAENCHINQGGEVEKRRAFVKLGAVSDIIDGFGLEVDSAHGPVYFWNGQNAPTAPITAIQLRFPVFVAGTDFITSVVSSTNFGGKTFCIGKTTSGKFIFFYDGVPVAETYTGVVWPGTEALQYIASQLQAVFSTVPLFFVGLSENATPITTTTGFTQPAVGTTVNIPVISSAGFTLNQFIWIPIGGNYIVTSIPDGTHVTLTNLGYSGNAAPTTVIGASNIFLASYVLIVAPLGQTYTLQITVTSVAGTITDVFLGQGQPSIPASSATGAISINAGATFGQFTQIVAPNGIGGFINLLGSPVLWTTDNITTAALLAQAINQYPTTPKYNAQVKDNTVIVTAPTTPTAVVYNGLVLNISYNTSGGDMDFNTATGQPLSVSVAPLSVGGISAAMGSSVYASAFLVCTARQGTSPYKFSWQITEPIFNGSPITTVLTVPVEIGNVAGSNLATSGVLLYIPYTSTIQAIIQSRGPSTFAGTIQCTVTDDSTPTQISETINVPFSFLVR